jgi:hypothetical protein
VTTPCVDPTHFQINADGAIAPQPWMQYRQVATGGAPAVAGSYAVTITFQADKDDLLQDTGYVSWTNDTPLDQWVYGLITVGGSRVTLQARSTGGISIVSGYAQTATAADLTALSAGLQACSVLGCGANMGVGGILADGTAFCIMEVRQRATSYPLAPQLAGWYKLVPGATFTGQVQSYFTSDYWETSEIEGGNGDTESDFVAGAISLGLFAVPVL